MSYAIDLHALQTFLTVVAAGDTITFEERFVPLLLSLQALIPATSATAGVVDLSARSRPVPREHLTAVIGVPPEDLPRYLGEYVKFDPALTSILQASGEPTRWSDHGGLAGRPRPFRRFMDASGVHRLLGWSLLMQDGTRLLVSLHRPEDMEDFSDAELELARAISGSFLPVGERAVVGQLLGSTGEVSLAGAGGLLTLDWQGERLTADRVAAGLLARLDRSARNELLLAVEDACRSGRVGRVSTPGSSDLDVRVTAIRSGTPARAFRYAVSVRLSALPLAERALLDLGLTEQECRVALLVAEGKSDLELKDALGRSPSRVRKILDGIRRRFQLQSRAALSAWVVSATQRGLVT
ncbi:MAG: hypothetical protein M9894_33100 [Planctomycetes bacterium]|nr:hypothetical protein [Planctomycetota bacterium]